MSRECEPKTSKFGDEVVYWTFAAMAPQRLKIFWRMSWIVEPQIINKTLPKAQLPRESSVFLKVSKLKKLISRSVNHLQGQAVIGFGLDRNVSNLWFINCPFKFQFQKVENEVDRFFSTITSPKLLRNWICKQHLSRNHIFHNYCFLYVFYFSLNLVKIYFRNFV